MILAGGQAYTIQGNYAVPAQDVSITFNLNLFICTLYTIYTLFLTCVRQCAFYLKNNKNLFFLFMSIPYLHIIKLYKKYNISYTLANFKIQYCIEWCMSLYMYGLSETSMCIPYLLSCEEDLRNIKCSQFLNTFR